MLLALTGLLLPLARAGAQSDGGSSEAAQRWALEGLRSGFCVRFLMDSAAAAKELPRRYVPVPVLRADSVHPALVRAAEGYADTLWVASDLCLYAFDAVSVAGRRLADKRLEDPQALVLWSIHGVPIEGEPAARQVVASLLSNNWQIRSAAEPGQVRVEVVDDFSVGKVPESTDVRYTVRKGKTRLTWDGRLTGDTLRVDAPQEQDLAAEGNRGIRFLIRSTLRPAGRREMAGTLRIEGKDDLAKALQRSPIRLVGPMYFGGAGELEFRR